MKVWTYGAQAPGSWSLLVFSMGWCSSCSPLQLQQSSAASKLRPPLMCWWADNKKVFHFCGILWNSSGKKHCSSHCEQPVKSVKKKRHFNSEIMHQSDLPHYLCSYDSDSPPPRRIAGQTLPYIHVLLIYHMDFTAVCDLLRSEQQMRLRVFAAFKSVDLSERMWMHIFLWGHRNPSQKAFQGLVHRLILEVGVIRWGGGQVSLKMQSAARHETWCKRLSWTPANANSRIKHMQTN